MDTWSQQDQRRSESPNETGEFFTDQWGRQWHAEVEIKTGDNCGPFTPVGWSAPLDTPRIYITSIRGKRSRGAQRKPYDLEIAYDQWIADWTAAGRRWDEEATKRAVKAYGPAWDRKEIPSDVLLEVGPRPGAKLDAVKAAAQGHPYVLGLRPFDASKAKDVKLHDILFPKKTTDSADWTDEESVPELVATVPAKRGRPRKVEVSDEAWAAGKE